MVGNRDVAKETALGGRVVIWEEAARDGAQGKTLMTAPTRVALARATGALFGAHGPHHVIFAAGFPSIGQDEFEIIRRLAAEVDNCTLASHGRATKHDIDLGLSSLEGAKYRRTTFFIPCSDRMAEAFGLGTREDGLRQGLDMLAYALDRSGGGAIDIALSDASRAEPEFVADAIMSLHEAGAAILKLCDTVGVLYPRQASRFYQTLFARLPKGVAVGVHNHNDLGFALANNLEAVSHGARVVASSWLGLGERTGLVPTEQLLFALGHEPEQHAERLGYSSDFWLKPPDLQGIVPIAKSVSQATNVPLTVTTPIVGPGVNSISTGTPFRSPAVFQPFDPLAVLGVPVEVILTPLANGRVINAVAAEGGFRLTPQQTTAAMLWTKSRAYRHGDAVIPRGEFFEYLRTELARESVVSNERH